MEELLGSPSKVNNNNIVENLDVLKEAQSIENDLKNSNEIASLSNDKSTDDKLNAECLLESNDDQVKQESKPQTIVDNLINLDNNEKSSEVQELKSDQVKQEELSVENLLNEEQKENVSTATDFINELRNQATEKTSELTKSGEQLLEDLNDTTSNTVDSANLTAEQSLEETRESLTGNNLILNLSEDCSVQETKEVGQNLIHVSLDSTQNSSNDQQNTSADLSVTENLLKQLGLDNSTVDESNDSINLADQTTKEISLINISADETIEQAEQQIDQQLASETITEIKKESSEMFKDLTTQMNQTLVNFIEEIKPTEIVSQVEPVLEDFVTKNEESKLNKSETFIVHKTDAPNEENKPTESNEACSLIKEEESIKKEPAEESVKELVSEQISKAAETISHVIDEVKDDVLTQSKEYLKKADELIAEKKNLISDIKIPGLNVKSEEKAEDKVSTEKAESSNQSSNQQEDNQATEKSKQTNKKCIIS